MAFEIDLLPVGNGTKSGDAILLRYGDLDNGSDKQTVILIDGGYEVTADKIKQHLQKYYNCRSNGKYVIDLVILSHPDSDHVSGLAAIAQDDEIQINYILMQRPWDELDPSLFADGRITKASLERRIKNVFSKAVELDRATEDCENLSWYTDTINCPFGATLKILGPSKEFYRKLIAECSKTPPTASGINETTCNSASLEEEEDFYEDQEIEWNDNETTSLINESSLILLFEYKDTDGKDHKILFTGDAGKRGLTEAIRYADEIGISLENIEIIKMPHHGSRKNVSPEIMDSLYSQGTTCYISCSGNDEGHHPSKRLVNLLIQKGYRVLSTSGSTLHRSHNAPERNNFKKAEEKPYYPKMEKL